MNILDLKRKAQGWSVLESFDSEGYGGGSGAFSDRYQASLARLSPQVQAAIKSGKLTASYNSNGDITDLYTQNGDTQQIYDQAGKFVREQAAPSGGSFMDKAVTFAAKAAPLAFMGAAGAGALGYGPMASGMGGGTAAGSAALPAAETASTLGSGSGMSLTAGSPGMTASAGSLAPSLGASAGSTMAPGATGSIFGGSMGGMGLTGAQLLGSWMGSEAAKGAADTQSQSARDALGLQRQMYDDSVARSKPFYDTSVAANSKLSRLMGIGGNPIDVMQEDPGYQFRKSEGMKAVDNSAAARGMSLSGGAMKAMQKYGQDYASNEFNNVYNRLSGTAGGGQVANNVNSLATNYGGNASNLITGSGNAQAAGQVGSANAWSNGISGVVNNYQQNQLMNLLQRKP